MQFVRWWAAKEHVKEERVQEVKIKKIDLAKEKLAKTEERQKNVKIKLVYNQINFKLKHDVLEKHISLKEQK